MAEQQQQTEQISMGDALNALAQMGMWSQALAKATAVINAAAGAEQLERECLARIKTYPDAEKQAKKQYEATDERIRGEIDALKQSKVEAQARLTAVDQALAERTSQLETEIASLTQQRDTLAAAVAEMKEKAASV